MGGVDAGPWEVTASAHAHCPPDASLGDLQGSRSVYAVDERYRFRVLLLASAGTESFRDRDARFSAGALMVAAR